MILTRVMELTNQLGQYKRLAVGSMNSIPRFPEDSFRTENVSFREVVLELWKWYSEGLSHDLQFLIPRAETAEKSKLKGFKRLLDDQRHAYVHADFKRAADAKTWRSKQANGDREASDHVLSDCLLKELATALECLSSIARRISQNSASAETWRDHVALTSESEVRAVLADIGRSTMPHERVDYAVRRFNTHPGLKKANSPTDRANVAAVVALEIDLRPLSVQYSEILDEFGLIGDPMGRALLLVAHGVEAAGYKQHCLLEALRRAWPEIQSSVSPG